ncbi:uncharacterized protein LOC131619586 [Vicia villosa]|uniref:uncharacterized protein LOC131619586 n=1 Tax=Vicia villosa TaxID=3911 RepID=UPI00273C244B|nr:uncharacterized protein LOC131619586 [Vicia villosa]
MSGGERLGAGEFYGKRGMEDFQEFIGRMGVVDIPCVGGKFTWFKANGKAMSRLDRFLVSRNLMDMWGVIDQRIGKRDISDHVPIQLFSGNLNWGPKPFKFNNSWFKHEKFKSFIQAEWPKLKVHGRGDFVWLEKLKRLKLILRKWNREIFGWIDLKVDEEVDGINEMDNLLAENFGGSIDGLVEARREAFDEVRKTLILKESMLRLKSRQLWLKEGDKNSSFFHNSLKKRYKRNAISLLEGANGMVEGVVEVKEEVKRHFENFFKEEDCARPVPEGLNLKSLRNEDREWLEREPTEEEKKRRFGIAMATKARVWMDTLSNFSKFVGILSRKMWLDSFAIFALIVDSLRVAHRRF